MKTCEFPGCDAEESLPFKCKLCNKMYCSKHRLPEQHNCPMIGIYQSEEYRKSKISQTKIKEEKPKKSKMKYRGDKLYGPRDTDAKSVYLEPQDRFLTRSSFFNITGFRNDYFNLLTILGIFSVFITLSIIVEFTLYSGIPISAVDWNIVFINLGSINFVFGGYFVIQMIIAKQKKERPRIVLWIWGILLGVLSIFVPIFAIPGFLTFREGRSSYKNRGIIAFSGIAWILFWCTIIVILMLGNGFGVPYLSAVGYTPMLMLTFTLFSLLPFGIYAGRYISGWNRKVYISIFVFTFILFIIFLIARYR